MHSLLIDLFADNVFCIFTDAIFAFQWKEIREYNRPIAEERQILAKQKKTQRDLGKLEWKCITC